MDTALYDISGDTSPAPRPDRVSLEQPGAAVRSQAAWQRAHSQITIIVTIGVCVMALLWMIMYVVIDTEHDAALQHARNEGSNLSAAFQRDITQKLSAISRGMDAVADHMRAAHGEFDIYDWARDIPLLSSAVLQGGIVGPDGVLLSTTLTPRPPAIDFSDREHFRIHLDGKFRGLFISRPTLGRMSHQTVIQLSKRVDAADGRFLGVVVFSMTPAQLTELHNAIDLGPHDKMVVIGARDNIVRARFGAGGDGDVGTGRTVPSPPDAAGHGPVVAFLRESVIDHATRLHNVRYLEDYPLRVDVALDLAGILQPAVAHAKLIKALGFIATVILAGLLISLVVEIRRRTDREVKLGDEQDRLAAEFRLEAEMRRKLHASESRLRDYAEMASDWFWEMDADLRFIETPTKGPSLSGAALSSVGKRAWEIFDVNQRPEQWAKHRSDLLARRPFQDFRHSRPDGTGSIRHVSINGVPVFDDTGAFVGYRGTGRDITANVEAEVALRQSKDQAEASNTAKSAFLANMSHELRTPLNAIIGFAELIHQRKTGRITQDYVDWAGDILTSGRHLLDLINDVLELSRIEAGRFDLAEETVDLALALRGCLPMVRRQAETTQVRIDAAIPEKTAVVRADRRAIKQVMLNLLSNAVKFTPSGGVVSVRTEIAPTGDLALVVADTGIGIDPAALSKLCHPFVQADASTSRKYGGSGLGLAISTKIMSLHGGSLTIASALGEGTKVWISFPPDRIQTARRVAEAVE